MEKIAYGLQIWNLVDTIENMYLSRKFSISQLSGILGISETDVSKTLHILGYYHTLNRNVEVISNKRLIYGILTPEKFFFLGKYFSENYE